MKIYVLSAIFSADPSQNKPYLLISNNDNELLPIIEIESAQYFHKEIFHKIKSIFTLDTIKVESDCSYNFLDIQNELSVQYALDHYKFVTEEDLIITYGGVLIKYPCLENFNWTEYKLNDQYNGYSPNTNLNLLLDYIIQRINL